MYLKKTVHLWQLKGMHSSKLACERGTICQKKGMKGLAFLLKMVYKGKGLDLKAEPPPVPYTKCSCRESYEEDTVEPSTTATFQGQKKVTIVKRF